MTAPAQSPPAVIPPLETEAQALALSQVKAIYEAMRSPEAPAIGAARLANHAMLDGALSVAGVKMGAYDHRIIKWLSQYEPQMCAVIAGFVQRAAAAGVLTGRLHANPRYQAALKDAESDSWEGPGVSVEEMIAAADERRRAVRDEQVTR